LLKTNNFAVLRCDVSDDWKYRLLAENQNLLGKTTPWKHTGLTVAKQNVRVYRTLMREDEGAFSTFFQPWNK